MIKLKIPKWWHSGTSALHNLSEIGLTSKGNENKNKNQEDSFISESRSASSVTQSWPQGLQHARTPCPSPTPGAYSNSCPLSQWCRSTISSFVVPFSSHLQSFPASGSFQRSHFFLHQVAKVLEFQLQHQSFQWIFRTDFLWMDWFDLLEQSKGLSRLIQHHSSKASENRSHLQIPRDYFCCQTFSLRRSRWKWIY